MIKSKILVIQLIGILLSIHFSIGQEWNRIDIKDTYPWCIVAYDSLERSPPERIQLVKELGFNKYAYDWRDKHLDDTYAELKLATESDIEIISVWLWLNAERDSLYRLSSSNERIFSIIEELNLKTTFWVSFSENFFRSMNQEQSVIRAVKMVDFIATKANKIGCRVALYNHSGWFGNPYNQLEVIRVLPDHDLGLVYNFHHAHNFIDEFPGIAKAISPYLDAVNLNGMRNREEKIFPLGKGDHEKKMIFELQKEGFNGPWGILGHVAERDVKQVLRENLQGLMLLKQ